MEISVETISNYWKNYLTTSACSFIFGPKFYIAEIVFFAAICNNFNN
jgi:hypothetical protein